MNLKHIRQRRDQKEKTPRTEDFCPICKKHSMSDPTINNGAKVRHCLRCGFEQNETPKETKIERSANQRYTHRG
jgi:Zn ribbon nucleic-acid-binding protein